MLGSLLYILNDFSYNLFQPQQRRNNLWFLQTFITVTVSVGSSKQCFVVSLIKIQVEDCCIPLFKQAPESFLKKGVLSKMIFRKIRKNVKAISPIISVLLMIAIAVVASLVVYAWVMGYIGYQTGKTGDAVQIQSVVFSGTSPTEKVATVYLQNVGSTTITIVPAQCLYVNNLQDPATAATTLAPGTTLTITDTGSLTALTSGQTVTIKVTTLGGTYSQITEQAP
jgi:flagellin-like protein